METIESGAAARPQLLLRANPQWAGPADLDVVYRRLEQLECAHALLLRYADDLKRAYEAEREQRTRLSQATLDLVAVLARTLSTE